MNNFTFYSPTYFVFGKDQECETGKYVKRFGGSKVLIHYGGGSVVRSGLLDRVKASLEKEGISYVELGGVQPNPRSGLVYQGIDLCKKENVDFVLAVGGGSVIDTAKGIAAGAVYEGDFWDYVDKSGNIDSKSPEIYDREWGCYMTYPYWIARRNGMKLVNIAKCGATLALPAQKKNECFVTDKMETIPEDVDYILFKFGINDSWQVPVGSIDDTEADTFYGAWNIVLEWVRKNRPYAKVGVIASNDCKTEEYSLATAAVCLKYGIPCLDEEHDDNVPYFYSQKFKSCPEDVRHDRDSIYRVSSQNSHPNIAAHRFESLIVESFIRSL